MVIEQGNTIRTISEATNILSSAQIVEDFPTTFGIYDLNSFLGVLSLVDTPNLDFADDYLTVSDSSGRSKIKYFYSDPEMLTKPRKNVNMPRGDVNFTLDENFDETIKSRFRDNFNYASFSEGEKMRIDLALLFTWRAIAKLKNSTNTNLLILDEIFDSSLDSAGTDEFLKILNTLEGENVFVISHKQDVLVDKFKHTLKFEKNKNFSKMVIV